MVLGGDGGQRVPYQMLHLSRDGTQLFVRAAIRQLELRSRGIGDVVWVVDTSTLQRTAEVQLPAPAFDAAPTPDGRMLITSNTNTQDPNEKLPRVVEIPSGRELAHWQGALAAMQTAPSATKDVEACTGTVVGRIAWGYFDHRPVADGPVRVADSRVSARTDAEGRFRLEQVPLGTHVGTLDHARFSFEINRCGQTVDVGTVAYPLVHPDMQAMAAFDAFMHERFDRLGESPCWYREQIESVDETSPDRYVIVSRVFMHEWLDKPRSTPISRVYDVVVVRTSGTWQVQSLGSGGEARQEPGEPGAATSACAVARQTPLPEKSAPLAPPTSTPR